MYAFHPVFRNCSRTVRRGAPLLGLLLAMQVAHLTLLGQFGSNVQQFSQVAVNQGSTTSFTIHNPSDTETITVDVQLYFPAGSRLADGQVELEPGATETLSFGDADASLTRGWAELKSDSEFIATEFFQLFIGQLKPRVGVLPSVVSDEIRFLGFVNPQFKSGLAVHNPSSTEATEITVRVKDKAGQEPVGEKKLMLAPLQSEAGFLNEEKFFGAALSNYEGVVEISVSSPPVAVLSLIQEASGEVATVAVETQSYVVTGPTNTSLGRGALNRNTTGSNNTASGRSALVSNTTGSDNTASGSLALGFNTTGINNTASGSLALSYNTIGSNNTASGRSALNRNTTGSNNTASGFDALVSNTNGSYNTASGSRVLVNNTTGSNNTASGSLALSFNTNGSYNLAIGHYAGSNLVTGDNNIYVGNSGESVESNIIRIGDTDHTDAFIAGVQLVSASSRQFKQDIHDMDRASSDLMRLRPVTFRYKKEHDFGEGRLQYGLIGEEVAEVYSELVVYDDTGKVKTVEYQKLPAMLLNELQGQHRKLQEQEAVIADLTERLIRLEQVLAAQQSFAARTK